MNSYGYLRLRYAFARVPSLDFQQGAPLKHGEGASSLLVSFGKIGIGFYM